MSCNHIDSIRCASCAPQSICLCGKPVEIDPTWPTEFYDTVVVRKVIEMVIEAAEKSKQRFVCCECESRDWHGEYIDVTDFIQSLRDQLDRKSHEES